MRLVDVLRPFIPARLALLREPVAKRYWRRALIRRNVDYFVWRFLTNGYRTWRALLAGHKHPDARRIARDLSRRGIAVGPSEAFLTDDGLRALAEASTVILGRSQQPDVHATIASQKSGLPKEYLIELAPAPHSADSPLLKVALDTKLLETVSSYLGMWPRLESVSAWLNFPAPGAARSAQLWHRDPEDLKLVKVFIYLVDVDEGRGPFCYIPGTHPLGTAAGREPQHADRVRVSDAEMSLTFPPDSWRICTGPAKTMILADTLGYHRGGKAIDGNRILITFTFTSGRPFKMSKFSMVGTPTWITERIQTQAL